MTVTGTRIDGVVFSLLHGLLLLGRREIGMVPPLRIGLLFTGPKKDRHRLSTSPRASATRAVKVSWRKFPQVIMPLFDDEFACGVSQ